MLIALVVRAQNVYFYDTHCWQRHSRKRKLILGRSAFKSNCCNSYKLGSTAEPTKVIVFRVSQIQHSATPTDKIEHPGRKHTPHIAIFNAFCAITTNAFVPPLTLISPPSKFVQHAAQLRMPQQTQSSKVTSFYTANLLMQNGRWQPS